MRNVFLSDFMGKLYVKNMIGAYYVRKEVILPNVNVAKKNPLMTKIWFTVGYCKPYFGHEWGFFFTVSSITYELAQAKKGAYHISKLCM